MDSTKSQDIFTSENSEIDPNKGRTLQKSLELEPNENVSKDKELNILLKDDVSLMNMDIFKARKYYEEACAVSNAPERFSEVQVFPPNCLSGVNTVDASTLGKYRELGLKLISRGDVAVIVLAGGQGTRLGADYPKGMYNIGLPSGKSLFQIQAEKIDKLIEIAKEKFCSGCLPWFIMTSELTDRPTREYFERNGYFGLDPAHVIFFKQRSMPCFSLSGEILLETRDRVARSPDGHGGLYHALGATGILDTMHSRGIKHIHVYCVDNILVKVGDPTFLGYCVEQGAHCGVKVVEKITPGESLGVLCNVDGKHKIVEYSELGNCSVFETQDQTGRLKFNLGSICNHYFSLECLQRMVKEDAALKFHMARKKIPCLDEQGNSQRPNKPNGIKLEKFLFDAFPLCENLVAWEVTRDEFSPLKNSPLDSASDNPVTCCQAVHALHARWIETAGGVVVADETGNTVCEIAPRVSYEGEGLEERVKGKVLQTPLLLE